MNEESTNVPQLQTGQNLIKEELSRYWLDPTQDYPEPYYMLEYNGVPFSAIGGIQALSGKKKNGKSFVFTQLMAAILGDGCERTRHFLPGLQVPERTIEYLREMHGDPDYLPRVLYCDTEMEKLYSAKALRRVHWLCDWDMKEANDRFKVLWLKNMPREDNEKAHQRRYRLIRQAVEVFEPDIVFIDGLRDLMSSINEEGPAIQILSDLATLAEERRMCIWCALHQNPGGDSEEAKMRGWVGTELGNKVSDTLISIKRKDANGVTFTVKQQDARGKDLDDWKFEITEDAGNLGVPRITNYGTNLPSKSKEEEGDDPDIIIQWINQAQSEYEWPMSRADVKKMVFGDIGRQKNATKQQLDLQIAINSGWLVQSTMKKNGAYMLDLPEDLPF